MGIKVEGVPTDLHPPSANHEPRVSLTNVGTPALTGSIPDKSQLNYEPLKFPWSSSYLDMHTLPPTSDGTAGLRCTDRAQSRGHSFDTYSSGPGASHPLARGTDVGSTTRISTTLRCTATYTATSDRPLAKDTAFRYTVSSTDFGNPQSH